MYINANLALCAAGSPHRCCNQALDRPAFGHTFGEVLCSFPSSASSPLAGLPHVQDFRPEAGVTAELQMIVHPEERVADFAKAGSDIISVHAEPAATVHLDRTINQVWLEHNVASHLFCLCSLAVCRLSQSIRYGWCYTQCSFTCLLPCGLALCAMFRSCQICLLHSSTDQRWPMICMQDTVCCPLH